MSVSVPIKVKPNSFNSNLTPVKIALGFLFEIDLETVFKAFNKLDFKIVNFIINFPSFFIYIIMIMIEWIILWKTIQKILSVQHIYYNINLYKILRIFIIFIIILNEILTH